MNSSPNAYVYIVLLLLILANTADGYLYSIYNAYNLVLSCFFFFFICSVNHLL